MATLTGWEPELEFARNIDSLAKDAMRLRWAYEALSADDAETVRRADFTDFLAGTFPKSVWRWERRTWERLTSPRAKEWGPRRFTHGTPREERPKLRPLPEWLRKPMKDFVMALRGIHIDLLDLDDAWSGLDDGARRTAASAYPFTETVDDLLKKSAGFHENLLAALRPRSG